LPAKRQKPPAALSDAIFWVGQQTQFNHFARGDRNLAWIHIAFLCAVSLTPFSMSLAKFIHYRIALLVGRAALPGRVTLSESPGLQPLCWFSLRQ
jgi:hypothetical protein